MLEILLISLIVSCLFALIWEMIPDPAKKYWKYIRSVNRDARKGYRRKYNFSWRFNSRR